MANAHPAAAPHGLLASIRPQAQDPLLALMGEFRADPRAHKIDLGVGMYRDPSGITPVMGAVKAAERRLLAEQETKGYLGPEGNPEFVERLAALVFGERLAASGRIAGLQTPGGTGALRLALDLAASVAPQTRVWMGEPTWPNHRPLLSAARLQTETFRHFDRAQQTLPFHETEAALARAAFGDLVLLQACCHNPSGADYTEEQWRTLGRTLAARGLTPVIDFAYHGLGRGFEDDARGLHALLESVDECLIAYSCDKNFGLYRERVGALFLVAGSARAAQAAFSQAAALARANWSMPSDHGGAVVRIVLSDPPLTARWRAELDAMRDRIQENRRHLAAMDARFSPVAEQQGMFSLLETTQAAVARLKSEHAVYMVGSGRINLAGFRDKGEIERFARAFFAVNG